MVCDMLIDFSSPYFSTFTSSLQSASASFFLPGATESSLQRADSSADCVPSAGPSFLTSKSPPELTCSCRRQFWVCCYHSTQNTASLSSS